MHLFYYLPNYIVDYIRTNLEIIILTYSRILLLITILGMIGQSMESNSSYSLHDSIEDGSLSSDQSQLLMQELEQTKEEVKDMIHLLDDMRHTFKKQTEDISVKLRERSWMYTELEDKLKILPERYGTEIDEIVSLQQEKKERIQYQNNDRLVQITERLRMLDTKVSGIEIQKERDDDMGDLETIHPRDFAIKIISGIINFLVLIFHALFFLLSIPSEIIKPLTRSASRIVSSSLILVLFSASYVFFDELVMLYSTKVKILNG